MQDIPDSQYFEFGGSKYLVIPKNVNHTTYLYGEEVGQYALTIAELESDDTQSVTHFFQNATVTPTMIAKYSTSNGGFSTIKTDINGDGFVDTQMSVDGVTIQYTYTDLKKALQKLGLSQKQYKPFSRLISTLDKLGEHNDLHQQNHHKEKDKKDKKKNDKQLLKIVHIIKKYEKRHSITPNQAQQIYMIIHNLKNSL